MERLLTEEESRDCIDFAEGIERQDAKTLKAVREWLMDYCDESGHAKRGKYRGLCISCISVLFTALREGKMPGETD